MTTKPSRTVAAHTAYVNICARSVQRSSLGYPRGTSRTQRVCVRLCKHWKEILPGCPRGPRLHTVHKFRHCRCHRPHLRVPERHRCPRESATRPCKEASELPDAGKRDTASLRTNVITHQNARKSHIKSPREMTEYKDARESHTTSLPTRPKGR